MLKRMTSKSIMGELGDTDRGSEGNMHRQHRSKIPFVTETMYHLTSDNISISKHKDCENFAAGAVEISLSKPDVGHNVQEENLDQQIQPAHNPESETCCH